MYFAFWWIIRCTYYVYVSVLSGDIIYKITFFLTYNVQSPISRFPEKQEIITRYFYWNVFAVPDILTKCYVKVHTIFLKNLNVTYITFVMYYEGALKLS